MWGSVWRVNGEVCGMCGVRYVWCMYMWWWVWCQVCGHANPQKSPLGIPPRTIPGLTQPQEGRGRGVSPSAPVWEKADFTLKEKVQSKGSPYSSPKGLNCRLPFSPCSPHAFSHPTASNQALAKLDLVTLKRHFSIPGCGGSDPTSMWAPS